ncbi:unannotated protein [freshwater metagenome]|uniref:Unannotated protein n=1 Tax=freshwater metagenome TaxID=449393 RepID=A0A6J7JZ93_9ZZZZ
MRGRLVEQDHGRGRREGAGQREPLGLAGRQDASAGAHERVETVGQRRDEVVRAGERERVPDAVVEVDGRVAPRRSGARAQRVAQGAGRQARALRQPRQPAPPDVVRQRQDVDLAAADRPRVGVPQPREGGQQRRLARTGGAGQGDVGPGRQLDVGRHEPRGPSGRSRDGDAAQDDRVAGGVGGGRVARGVRSRGVVPLVEERERAPRGLRPVLRRVEPLAGGAQRGVDLRRQQEHEEARGEVGVARGEQDAGRGRGDRDAEHREELEDEGGEERDAQGAQRLGAVALRHGVEGPGLRALAAVGAQGRQGPDDLEEVRAEDRQRPLTLACVLRAGPADEHHEDDEHRQGDREEAADDGLSPGDGGDDREGHRAGQRDRRHRPGVVVAEGVDALDRGGDDVAPAGLVLRVRPTAEGPRGDPHAQGVARALGGAAPQELGAAGGQGAHGDGDREHDEREGRGVPTVDRRPDDVGDDPRLDDHRGRGERPAGDGARDEQTRRAGQAEQAAVDVAGGGRGDVVRPGGRIGRRRGRVVGVAGRRRAVVRRGRLVRCRGPGAGRRRGARPVRRRHAVERRRAARRRHGSAPPASVPAAHPSSRSVPRVARATMEPRPARGASSGRRRNRTYA